MAASRVSDCVNAAVDALKADVTLIGASLLGSAKVYTHVEQGTDAPYCMVIGGDEIPWADVMEIDENGGDAGGRQVDVVTQCVSTYRGSKQVDAIASRVMEVLTDPDTWVAVTNFRLAQFIRNSAQPPIDLSNDGGLWFVRFVTVRVTLA